MVVTCDICSIKYNKSTARGGKCPQCFLPKKRNYKSPSQRRHTARQQEREKFHLAKIEMLQENKVSLKKTKAYDYYARGKRKGSN